MVHSRGWPHVGLLEVEVEHAGHVLLEVGPGDGRRGVGELTQIDRPGETRLRGDAADVKGDRRRCRSQPGHDSRVPPDDVLGFSVVLAWPRSLGLVLALGLVSFACSETVVFPDDPAWQEPVTCPPTGNPRVLVTNSGDDTLSWIDLGPGAPDSWPVCTEPVGHRPPEREGPHHGAATASGSAYFVGLSNFVPGSGSGPHGSHGTGNVRGYLLKHDGVTHELVDDTLVDR